MDSQQSLPPTISDSWSASWFSSDSLVLHKKRTGPGVVSMLVVLRKVGMIIVAHVQVMDGIQNTLVA